MRTQCVSKAGCAHRDSTLLSGHFPPVIPSTHDNLWLLLNPFFFSLLCSLLLFLPQDHSVMVVCAALGASSSSLGAVFALVQLCCLPQVNRRNYLPRRGIKLSHQSEGNDDNVLNATHLPFVQKDSFQSTQNKFGAWCLKRQLEIFVSSARGQSIND